MPIDYRKYPADWKARRARVLARSAGTGTHPRCERCGVRSGGLCGSPRDAAVGGDGHDADAGVRGSHAMIYCGDALSVLRTLPDASVNTCVTSPPYYGLRDYGVEGQIGLEETPMAYVARLAEVFEEVRRVLRDDGTLWLNLGDSFARNPAKGGSGTFNGRNGYGEGYTSAARLRSETHGSSDGRVGRAARAAVRNGGAKEKDLLGIPWRMAFALQEAGWYLRSDIIWAKGNPMPESVTDRPTKAHEYIFLLAKSKRYYYDHEAVKEAAVSDHGSGNGFKRPQQISRDGGGSDEQWELQETRNRRSVWEVNTKPFPEAHFAVFPPELIEPCILAGAPEGGTVLDPFSGSGTTGLVSLGKGRNYVGIELNPEYVAMSERRIRDAAPLFYTVTVRDESAGGSPHRHSLHRQHAST